MNEREPQPDAEDVTAEGDDVEGHMINIGFDPKPLPVPGGPPIRGPKAPDTGPGTGPVNDGIGPPKTPSPPVNPNNPFPA